MSSSSGKPTKKHVEAPVNHYEKQRLERIEANNKMCENLGIKRIVASITKPDSTKEKKVLTRSKSEATLHQDSDYTPENDPSDDDNDGEEDNVAGKKKKVYSTITFVSTCVLVGFFCNKHRTCITGVAINYISKHVAILLLFFIYCHYSD